MQIETIDILIIAIYFIFVTIIGLKYSGRAGQNMEEFFVSGRSLPWWLAGTSMVATTFSADTPLAVTGLVAEHGIAGNWLWWNMVMSGLLTVFFYARLWRRSGVLTDVEFTEIRYGGKPAAFLRGFRALYLTLPINSIILGWVTLAMAKIIGTATGLVFILRWYWWRINAWSEISAMIASFTISIFLQVVFGMSSEDPRQFSLLMLITVFGSTAIWLAATFLTAPEDDALLVSFYKRVRPAGRLWQKIYQTHQLEISKDSLGLSLRAWIIGLVFVSCFLFAVGSLLFGEFWVGILLLAISACSAILLWLDLNRF